MKIAGIVCEYNPFHNGHAYHIAESRRIAGVEGIVCVMSGAFVQRGDFAMFEKHARAAAAVLSGVDLVIALPTPWAVASAERFAFGAVALLDALGVCTHLSFGSECGDIGALEKAAELLGREETGERVKAALRTGLPYAAARGAAVGEQSPACARLLEEPNNLLAVEYLKAIRKLGSAMEPVTIPRFAAGHDARMVEGRYASASFLRSLVRGGGEPWEYMPEPAAGRFQREIAQGRAPVCRSAAESAMLAKLRTMTEEEYARLPDSTEGLHRRLMRAGMTAPTLDAVAASAKTKRYAMSRLRRMLLCAYLGVTARDTEGRPPYVQVLAAGERGPVILREIAEKCPLPLIIKPASAKRLEGTASRLFALEARATDLYCLTYPSAEERTGGQEWTRSPIFLV